MGNVALTLLTLLLLQLLAAAGWALAGWKLDLSRRAAAHWSISAVLGAVTLGLVLARGTGPDWLTIELSSVVGVASLLTLRRGLLQFLHLPTEDIEAVLLLGMLASALALASLLPAQVLEPAQIALNCLGMLYVLLRTAVQVWPVLRREFGEPLALFITAPLLAGASLFAIRLVAVLAAPSLGMRQLPLDSAPNIAVALMLLLLSGLLHGSLAAVVLLRMVNKLRRLSQHDDLTGLVNRAEWLRQLDAHHRWLGRYGEPFGLLMLDIDHFKNVNDTLGHAAGDAVLSAIAQVLIASARDVDVVGRIGGEEFCILLPRADAASVRGIAERLRQAIGDTEIQWRQRPVRVTVSAGLAMVDDALESPLQALERADQALYLAKRGGRNRVVLAPPAPVG